MCRVKNGSGSKEASITISVLHDTHSGPSYTPGEEPGGAGQDPPLDLSTMPREGACGLFGDIRTRGATRQALTLHSLPEEMRGLRMGIRLIWLTWDPHHEGTVFRIHQ